MSFLRVHNLNYFDLHGRLYDHSAGSEVFPNETSSLDYFLRSAEFMTGEGLDYFIAISWGENKEKILDIFGYSELSNWKSNPEVKNWVVRNGIISQDRSITCGEGLILLGREEEHRLKTMNLEEYLSVPLDIREINRIIARE
ncbi:MAG: hypothetical protein ACW963_04815 [Candidatus Sifarchaeia archaeon]|jgi:hypothetical protein